MNTGEHLDLTGIPWSYEVTVHHIMTPGAARENPPVLKTAYRAVVEHPEASLS
jgi:hypothetical protein